MRLHDTYFDAAKVLSQSGFGARISHESMAELVKAPARSKAYYGRVCEVRDILRTHYHIFLETVVRGGYEIVPPGNEISLCESRFLSGYRQMAAGVVHSADIDVDRIQDQQKRVTTIEKAQKMAALAGMVKHGLAFGQTDKQALTCHDAH